MYYNRRLEPLGMPFVAECAVTGSLGSFDDVRALAAAAGSALARLAGAGELRVAFSERELIGRSFELYKFRALSGVREVGHLRLVALGGRPVNASAVFYPDFAVLADRGAFERLLKGERLKEGETLGPTFSSRECGGESPVGQKEVPKFVIYDAEGFVPPTDLSGWRLRVVGVDGRAEEYTLERLREMARDLGAADFHCVTGWSVRGRSYTGVPLKDLLARVAADGRWVVATSMSGYSSVIPIEEAANSYVILGVDGRELAPESGRPARIFNPRLYGWKSAKWLASVEVVEDYVDGYWEALAYHERGLVSANERFKIRNPEIHDLCPG